MCPCTPGLFPHTGEVPLGSPWEGQAGDPCDWAQGGWPGMSLPFQPLPPGDAQWSHVSPQKAPWVLTQLVLTATLGGSSMVISS